MIKYLVDKNNLIFVYFNKFESGGRVRETVKTYMLINFYGFIIVMGSFFGIKFHTENFKWMGPLFLVGWTVFFVYFKDKIEPNSNF